MCGIAGTWYPDKRPPDPAALRRMTRALTYRGLDDEGYYEEPGLGLGHRRLSIIDLPTGHQPLCNEDGSIWVIFNGEIFNYLELRASLQKSGHKFRTHSDTETLVHLYEEKGLDFVHELNGQFAIALWDRPRQRLVLVRDRVGVRPLFYATLRDGSVLFGSEIKALLAHGALRAEIDPVALGQITTLWVSIPPRTAFQGVNELGPGRMLVIEDGCRSEHQYWRHQFPQEHEYEDKSLEHWVEQTRTLLEDAVRLQLRADVPVATYLSGGLDSSIVTALAKRHHSDDLTTFSVGFTDTRYDESASQRLLAEYLGTRHRHLEVDAADIGRTFGDVVWHAERPLLRTAPAPLLRLAGLVHDSGLKVALSGEGADEVFAGYNLFREEKVRRFWARNPDSAWRASLLGRIYCYVERDRKADAFWRLFFKRGLTNTVDPFYSHRIRWANAGAIRNLFAADVRAAMQSDDAMLAEIEAHLGTEQRKWHPLCRAQYLEMTLFMSGYLLSAQGDRMAMAHSVEGRVPFLDHRIIEFAARIPPKYKLRGLKEKYILKKAFADLLPAVVTANPKRPYRAPIMSCFSPGSDNLGTALLQQNALERSRLFEASAVRRLLRKMADSGFPSERDEMALALVVSTQLLHHLFI